MPNKGRIAIIVEGERREPYYLKRMAAAFPPLKEIEIICLPTEKNIYMLWKQLNEDDFGTDMIELIRENASPKTTKQLQGLTRDDFQEIYLFFDFDPQQTNLGQKDGKDPRTVLAEMLETFDNETENGRLYISYPMSEALRDITPWSCKSFSDCFFPADEISDYKTRTGEDNPYASVQKYDTHTWHMIAAIFLARCRCLMNGHADGIGLYHWYKEALSVSAICARQIQQLDQAGTIFVLSAFPEFLLDYFKEAYMLPLLMPALSRVEVGKSPLCGRTHGCAPTAEPDGSP